MANVRRRPYAVVTLLVALVASLVPAAASAQTPPDVGNRAHSFTSAGPLAGGPITGEKPESKLWFHDDRWWAAMVPADGTARHTIHWLDEAAATWRDTGQVIANSRDVRGDALLVGNDLYITLRTSNPDSRASSSTLYRARWNADTETWVPRAAATMPVPANVPTLTIAKDAAGRLWIAWLSADDVHVAVAADATNLAAANWTIVDLSTVGAIGSRAVVGDDDSVAVTSFTDATGAAIGVMWSNQRNRQQYFAINRSTTNARSWSLETIGEGVTREADDHINLKTHGRLVYAAIKTEHSTRSPDTELIRLLVRSPSGTWRSNVVAHVDERDTRPIASLEVTNGYVYVFMTRNPFGDQRHVVYKRARLAAVAPGSGVSKAFDSPAVTFMRAGNGQGINDPTTMKAPAGSGSGIVVLASGRNDYWWNRLDVTAPQPASYNLTTTTVGRGTVTRSPGGTTYSVGTRVTLTAQPWTGYRFTGWSGAATGTTNPLAVTVDRNLSITATFAPDPNWSGYPAHGFPDVPRGAHYDEAVAWLKFVEITGGFPDGTFGPNRNVTRGQMASFLHRLMDRPLDYPPHGFRDVSSSAHYDVPLRWLAAEGIATGFGDGTFGPGRPVTRGQMASFLHRLVGEPGGYPAHGFSDVSENAHNAAAIRWLRAEGITTGFSDGTYRPQLDITRGQMASLLYRLAKTPKAWHDTPLPTTAPPP